MRLMIRPGEEEEHEGKEDIDVHTNRSRLIVMPDNTSRPSNV
jgi:hypothetical protein